jgi:hypothetical protein
MNQNLIASFITLYVAAKVNSLFMSSSTVAANYFLGFEGVKNITSCDIKLAHLIRFMRVEVIDL